MVTDLSGVLRVASVIVLGFALLVAGACQKREKTTTRAGPAAESAAPGPAPQPTPAAPTLAASAPGSRRSPRDPATLVPPPLSPPSGAQVGPLGVRWQGLTPGSGESTISAQDTVVADYSVWTPDGKLAYSSRTKDRPAVFNMTRVGQAFHTLLSQVKPGGTARFWVPRAALKDWRPETWPDSDLVIELEMISVHANTIAKP